MCQRAFVTGQRPLLYDKVVLSGDKEALLYVKMMIVSMEDSSPVAETRVIADIMTVLVKWFPNVFSGMGEATNP